MAKDAKGLQDDVYRISDVVRGARRIVIVVGRTGVDHLDDSVSTMKLLKEWGRRMWTWPEILLGPVGEKILIYTRGKDLSQPLEFSRSEFPNQVWEDGDVARQLIDNYENKLSLSRLELVVLALQSLKNRVQRGTKKYLDGDLSYALMGLLRQRPKVDATDSAFQAFARLSLANDSDRLLERMICLLPPALEDVIQDAVEAEENEESVVTGPDKRHWWATMDDFWGAKLWDVEPLCQIAGIANDDSVIIDGAFAATIHWDKFQRVAITTRETFVRKVARSFIRAAPGWFFGGVIALAASGGGQDPTATAIGVILLLIAISIILASPWLILQLYGGKVWNSQPWLLGFEGHMSIKEIECKIFGFPSDRLAWTPYSSSLSHHQQNADPFIPDECEGTDPLLQGKDVSISTRETTDSKMKTFTIVDTDTM
jgi:hypothetical protein